MQSHVNSAVILAVSILIAAGTLSPPANADVTKTLSTLWSMNVERQTPYNVQIVDSKTDGDYKTDVFYLDSKPLPDVDADRVVCTFSRIVKPGVVSPVFINFGGWTPADVHGAASGLHCAYFDIDLGRKDLAAPPKWATQASPYNVTPKVTDNMTFHLIMATRRVIDYLYEQPEIDKTRIGIVGSSFGAWYSLLTAGVDNRITSVCAITASGGQKEKHGWHSLPVAAMPPDQQQLWIESYDPMTYAKHNTSTTMMYESANDYSFWLNDTMRHYEALAGDKRLVLLPNNSHGFNAFGYSAPDALNSWAAATINGGPAYPTITKPIQHGADYTFDAAGPLPITSAKIYFSPGDDPVWPAHYWMTFDASQTGAHWTASIPAPYAALCGNVYATAFDSKGRAVSTMLVPCTGFDPAAASAPLWKGGALWDVETGISAWRIPGPGKRMLFSRAKAASAGPGALKVTPDKDGQFLMLTNSVVLSSSHAAKHAGIRLVIDGQGQAGKIRVSIDQKPCTIDEISYVREVEYSATASTIDIPWAQFAGPANATGPVPFQALRIEGSRDGGTPIVFNSIDFYDQN